MSNEVTQLLSALDQSDPHAAGRLRPLVDDELRKLAAQRLTQEQPGKTLQPTALAHEAYLRLVGQGNPGWENRDHFFGAAEAMRRSLVHLLRRRVARTRGEIAWLSVRDHRRALDEPLREGVHPTANRPERRQS